MTIVDLGARLPQYVAHLRPAWDALPDEIRGVVRGDRGGPDPAGRAILVGSHADALRARRDGYARIAYLEHGIGQPYGPDVPGYPGGARRDGIGLFLSPNETAAEADRRAYPRAQVRIVGDPRLDTLPARDPVRPTDPRRGGLDSDQPVVAISFHWDARFLPETRSALRHYSDGLAELRDYFPLIGHAHPRAAAQLGGIYRRLGIEFVRSFDDVCRRADVYVCDNSSTLYEFASTGRPVVVLNAPWYRRNVRHGLRFWDAANVGTQVDGPGAGLVLAIDEALTTDRMRGERGRALELAYAFRSGAAARAAAELAAWA